MSRKESEAVPVGNGPVPQQVGPDQPTLEEVCRMIKEVLTCLAGEAIRCKNIRRNDKV